MHGILIYRSNVHQPLGGTGPKSLQKQKPDLRQKRRVRRKVKTAHYIHTFLFYGYRLDRADIQANAAFARAFGLFDLVFRQGREFGGSYYAAEHQP